MLTAAQLAAERLKGTSVAVIRTHEPDMAAPEGEPRVKRTKKRS